MFHVTYRTNSSVYIGLIACVLLFFASLYLPKTVHAAMSKEVGVRLVDEYNKSCKSYDPSAKKSKKEDRCSVVREALVKEAKCNFGSKKATSKQLESCKTKVNKLKTQAQLGVTGGGGSGGGATMTGATQDELTSLDITPVKDAGVENPEQSTIDKVVNIVFSLAGGLALLFTVIGGLRFILSSGDPQNTARAKNTIIYALVGLLVTMFAFAIVKFVTSRVL